MSMAIPKRYKKDNLEYFFVQTMQCVTHSSEKNVTGVLIVQYALDLRKILGVAKKFLKSRSFLFQTQQNP